jgi:hypothetical protein
MATTNQIISALQITVKSQEQLIKLLVKLYDEVGSSFIAQNRGHNTWQNVQDTMDRVDDLYDLSQYRG